MPIEITEVTMMKGGDRMKPDHWYLYRLKESVEMYQHTFRTTFSSLALRAIYSCCHVRGETFLSFLRARGLEKRGIVNYYRTGELNLILDMEDIK